jgi:hypothetical protein
MPFKKFTAGDVLTAAQVNTNLMKQSVMQFASATARNTALSGELVEGMVAYLADTDTLTVYDGTGWGTIGAIGRGSTSSAQTGIGTSVTDLTSLSVSWTAVSSRLYRLTAFLPQVQQKTSIGIVTISITTGANAKLVEGQVTLGINGLAPMTISALTSGLSGSVTYKVRGVTSANTFDLLSGDSRFLLVEDIGKA